MGLNALKDLVLLFIRGVPVGRSLVSNEKFAKVRVSHVAYHGLYHLSKGVECDFHSVTGFVELVNTHSVAEICKIAVHTHVDRAGFDVESRRMVKRKNSFLRIYSWRIPLSDYFSSSRIFSDHPVSWPISI